MGSLGGGGEVAAKKAMWLYPKVMGFNPPERWGHSACYSNSFVYIFGGCCGGLHFSDVLMLNLDTMAWNNLVTTGQGPGPRDSHTAVLVGHRMIVFGGTNGTKKVNDLHVLDLRSREWTRPSCKGVAPSPRESHTATVVADEKLVIFGGSGEGGANYLNDLHVLDLKTMTWSSPDVKGDIPVPRDSHSAIVLGNKLCVYGGDCGDRYQGDVDMLDMDTLTWSRLAVQGPSPGVRAGHAAVSVGTKVYVIGGVGDKKYYNDVWVFDTSTCCWTQLEVRGQQPQGRFSHTAIVTDSDIAIYGGCGEDERPLNELLILQLGAEHPNGRYNISMCKIFGSHCSQERRRLSKEGEINSKTIILGDNVDVARKEASEEVVESKGNFLFNSDTLHSKRRRTVISKTCEIVPEPEEHSLSLSQHSSPSHSDQEQTPIRKAISPASAAQIFPLCKQQSPVSEGNWHANRGSGNQTHARGVIRQTSQDLCFLGERGNQQKPEQYCHPVRMSRHEVQFPAAEHKPLGPGHFQNMIGADVRGKVDGAFDSGYLMTATVNGKLFRGVLFAPGPEVVSRVGNGIPSQNHSTPANHVAQPAPHLNHLNPRFIRHSQQHPTTILHAPQSSQANRPSPVIRTSSTAPPSLSRDPKLRSELQGVVLTLGGPGSGQGGL